jgi:hypothetical protein
VRAVVNRFSLNAAALRMAIEASLLPWAVEEADAGVIACMRRWVQQRGNMPKRVRHRPIRQLCPIAFSVNWRRCPILTSRRDACCKI